MVASLGETAPFPPWERVCGDGLSGFRQSDGGERHSRPEGGNGVVKNPRPDGPIMIQIQPAVGEPNQDVAEADDHGGDHLQQARPPGRGLAFSEWIPIAAAVDPAPSFFGSGRASRGAFVRLRVGGIRHDLTQMHQQIQGGRAQVQPVQVDQVVMIAEPAGLQVALQSRVAVLTFAAVGLLAS